MLYDYNIMYYVCFRKSYEADDLQYLLLSRVLNASCTDYLSSFWCRLTSFLSYCVTCWTHFPICVSFLCQPPWTRPCSVNILATVRSLKCMEGSILCRVSSYQFLGNNNTWTVCSCIPSIIGSRQHEILMHSVKEILVYIKITQ